MPYDTQSFLPLFASSHLDPVLFYNLRTRAKPGPRHTSNRVAKEAFIGILALALCRD